MEPLNSPLDAEALRAADRLWTTVRVVPSTGSTNADLLERAADADAAEGEVLVTEEQTAGRGRLGRSWSSVPGASLTFSVLLRPASVPAERRGWLPLLAGVAVASAVRSVTGVDARLKWPNDVLAGERKLAGILAEQSPDGAAVVIGIGLNVVSPGGALPPGPGGLPATSLAAEGATASRQDVLLAILERLAHWYTAFRADPDPAGGLLEEYRVNCATLGRQVRAELPAGRVLAGLAVGIDASGSLLIAERDGEPATPVSAGDVIHLRG